MIEPSCQPVPSCLWANRARPKVSTAIMGLRVPAPQILTPEAPEEDKGKRRPGTSMSMQVLLHASVSLCSYRWR